MQFFTRQRHNALQAKPSSKAEAKANRDWANNIDLYGAHFKVIAPKLPESAMKFAEYGFHDARLLETHFGNKTLSFLLDTQGCFAVSKSRARLTFEGVHDYSRMLPHSGESWLYEELHLEETGFCLHVLFDKTDFRVSADQIYVELF